MEMNNGIIVDLKHSYAGAYFNKIMLIGTDGFMDYNGEEVKIYYPREIYKDGRFTTPPCQQMIKLDYSKNWSDSLKESIKNWIY